jgi:beta-mannosidase
MGLNVTVRSDGETVDLSARKPVKGIVLDVEGDGVYWSDQAIDLAPHDPQTIKAKGLKGRKLKIRFLGDGQA